MSSEVKVVSNQHINTDEKQSPIIIEKIKEHAELTAAIICGILIASGWIYSMLEYDRLSIALFIFAFLIGGFAKAKEGIEAAIENKELNVEMLMIFAAIGS